MTDMLVNYGNDPKHWKNTAVALVYNAQVLTQHRRQHEQARRHYREEHEVSDVDMTFASLVLWGYAVECFLKCLYLKKGGALIGDDGKIKREWGNHQLIPMAKKAEFQLNPTQRRILEYLSIITNWSGRYPIAKTLDDTSISHSWAEPYDDDALDRLIELLRLEIK